MKYLIGFIGGFVFVIFNFIFFVCGIITGDAIFGRTTDKIRGHNSYYSTAYRGYSSYDNRKEN